MPLPGLVVATDGRFHDEILAHRGEVPNFASFLRVTCLRYLTLRHQKQGERPSLAVIGSLAPLPLAATLARA